MYENVQFTLIDTVWQIDRIHLKISIMLIYYVNLNTRNNIQFLLIKLHRTLILL